METSQKEPGAEQLRPQIEREPLEQLTKEIRRFRWVLILVLIALLFPNPWNIPGVGLTVNYLYSQVRELAPAPRAKGDKFAVALARLDNDRDGKARALITAALGDRKDIEPLLLDQDITVKGSGRPQQAIQAGQERAHELLRQTNTALMIWGEVLRAGTQSTLSLHWTATTAGELQNTAGRHTPEETHALELPQVFWKDMDHVVGMIVLTEQARRSSPNGQAIADQLKAYIEQVSVLLDGDPQSPEERVPLQEALGYALATYGDKRGDSAALERAVAVYQAALQGRSRERAPLQWAQTQRHLGGALQTLAERARSGKDAQDAVEAFKSAAEVDPGAAEAVKGAQALLERLRRAPGP